MAINYNKVGWDTTKYFNPTNMNHMDDGIKAACDKADANEKAIEQANSNLNDKTKWKYLGCIAQNGKVSINEEFNELLVCLLDENNGIYNMRISTVIPFHYVESTPAFEVNTYITERAYATLLFNNSTKELICTTLSGEYVKLVGVYYR